jgi:hypothetical protein
MKHCIESHDRVPRLLVPLGRATALAVALAISQAHPARASEVTVPPIPGNIQVTAPNIPYLVGHGVGTQDYVCLPAGTGFKFTLFTPEATLFNENGKQIITHYFSPNPDEGGTVRATWQSRDTSTVWGSVGPNDSSSDPAFVKPGAIAWLKVTVVGNEEGRSGGDKLTQTTFIQRLNTAGGLAPSTGCASASDVGKEAFIHYSADYFFYKEKDKYRHR